MRNYKNVVNWRLPEDLKKALRIRSALENKHQKDLAIEILTKALLKKRAKSEEGE